MRFRFRRKPDCSGLQVRLNYFKLCVKSLTYNTYSSYFDVMFEPVITIVDFVSRWFGFAFVSLVVILVCFVVGVYYIIVIPHLRNAYSPLRASLTIAYGHYLLVMIVFHYYKGVRTHPGKPPKQMSEVAVTSVCKRCILPKPPRTHHCSVCGSCILKMDHHCPWLNNCVGHFNHRYFISFCIFMLLGTVFVSTTTWPLFHDCFNVPYKIRYTVKSLYVFFGYDTNLGLSELPSDPRLQNASKTDTKFGALDSLENQDLFEIFSHRFKPQAHNRELKTKEKKTMKRSLNSDLCIGRTTTFKNNILFLWLLCSAVTVSLGILTTFHIGLISRCETSIERLINTKQRQKAYKQGTTFINPYDLGFVRNWKMILGFKDFRSFVSNVVLPQTSLPLGDGVVWDAHISKEVQV